MHATTARHWATLEAQRERVAAHRIIANKRHGEACAELHGIAIANDAKPLPVESSEAEIGAAADRRAAWLGERVAGLSAELSPLGTVGVLNAWLAELQARPFMPACKWANNLRGALARVQCPLWWRRQMRRDVVRRAESQAIAAGAVNAKAGQWYASDETVRRRIRQNKRNALILERTELESEDGDVYTLKALADKGTANKAIRRGELMTRIRGCEEWAEGEGHAGLFLTLTCPSRFHQQLYSGGMNPKYRGDTPRDAQDWLCATWARARAQLARLRVKLYGFRVAEPHHDGCPHWHALVWVESARDALLLRSVLRAQWLADSGDEPGAAEHRVKCVDMMKGGAAGYVAKYIAKNIDDAGTVAVEGHQDHDRWSGDALGSDSPGRDSDGGSFRLQGELFANPAQRVEAWAAAWGIRQFQAIGQPPVTVWRELRRVPLEAAPLDAEGRGPARIALALDAVNRDDEQRACWYTYLQLQGGTNTGRDYAIRIALRREEFAGRYETAERARPLGVYEAGAPDALVPSVRREWKPRGAWGARGSVKATDAGALARGGATPPSRRAPPWTRVNNCTRGNFGAIVGELLARLDTVRQAQFAGGERWQT